MPKIIKLFKRKIIPILVIFVAVGIAISAYVAFIDPSSVPFSEFGQEIKHGGNTMFKEPDNKTLP